MVIRPDSQRVEVYNEGLAVYLHDPANAAAILEANPRSVLGMEDVEPAKDKALKKPVATHWDGPPYTTLSCRPIGRTASDVFRAQPGDRYTLTRPGAD